MKAIVVLLVLFGAGYFFYQQNAVSAAGATSIKTLLDRVDSNPVDFAEARATFKGAIVEICRVNGQDTANGYGTEAECMARVESSADPMCAQRLSTPAGGRYTSRSALKADFSAYMKCAMNDVDKTGK